MISNRKIYIFAVLLVLVLGAAFILISLQPAKGKTARLVVGGPSDLTMLIAFAKDRGLFEKYNVEVDLRDLQTGKISQDALMSGDLDVGIIVDTNIAFIGYQGAPSIKVLASVQEQHGDGIIARSDHGIKKPSDLLDKTIGYVPATTSHVFLARYAEKNNLDFNRFKLLAMSPPALQSAIVRGDIDAVSIFQPFRYNAATALGGRAIEFTDPSAYTVYALLAVRNDVLKTKRATLTRFLQALVEAEHIVGSDQNGAVSSFAREMGVSSGTMHTIWPEYTSRVRFDQGIIATVRADGQWIRATQDGFIAKPMPDYGAYMSPDILRTIDPNRVSIRQ